MLRGSTWQQSKDNSVNKPKAINFYGGPGTGKSTMAARVLSELKMLGVNCELITEYAKKKVWEGSMRTLQNQIYVFGKQQHAMWSCANQVQCVVTDSPLMLTCIYCDDELFHQLAWREFENYDNINIFLTRVKEYNPKGRLQTLDEAKGIDARIKAALDKQGVGYVVFNGELAQVEKITDYIVSRLACS